MSNPSLPELNEENLRTLLGRAMVEYENRPNDPVLTRTIFLLIDALMRLSQQRPHPSESSSKKWELDLHG
jgi:hypothetical protein